MRINKISSEKYDEMWCRHKFYYCGGTSVNTNSRCCGRDCPALVITEIDGGKWVGYCGVDHPNTNRYL